MIVDVNTHIWDTPEQLGQDMARRILKQTEQPWDRPDASTTAHFDAMTPVCKAFILGFESKYLGASISASKVASYVERAPEKNVGFVGIDPLSPGYLHRVDEAVAMGHVGVAISPAAQACHPVHTRAMALYEKCEAVGLPVIVQSAAQWASKAILEFGRPYLLDEVARTFPKLRMVISGAGFPWVDQTLILIGKHEHVYTDISDIVRRPWQLYNTLQSAHQLQVMDRLLFGSDFPFCTPEVAIQTIYSVNTLTKGTPLPSLPREQLRSIVERDVFSVLGISHTDEIETGSGEPDSAGESVKRNGQHSTNGNAAAKNSPAPAAVNSGGSLISSGDDASADGVSREAIQAVVAAGTTQTSVTESDVGEQSETEVSVEDQVADDTGRPAEVAGDSSTPLGTSESTSAVEVNGEAELATGVNAPASETESEPQVSDCDISDIRVTRTSETSNDPELREPDDEQQGEVESDQPEVGSENGLAYEAALDQAAPQDSGVAIASVSSGDDEAISANADGDTGAEPIADPMAALTSRDSEPAPIESPQNRDDGEVHVNENVESSMLDSNAEDDASETGDTSMTSNADGHADTLPDETFPRTLN